ncbi:MAG: hypothetical protein IPK82_34455 [Polyangiaceae bacterium]|nr:hypothetical protein [Polyangiaceae bacterium]
MSRPTKTDSSHDPIIAPPSAPLDPLTQEPDVSPSVNARAWGGLGVSQWNKPSVESTPAKKSFLGGTMFLSGGLAILIAKGVVAIWGKEYGLPSFLAAFVLLFVIVGIVRLAPSEKHRSVLLTVTEDVLSVEGGDIHIVLPLARVMAFRACDGARPGTTCFAVEAGMDVLYFEVDQTAGLPLIRTLGSKVPSVLKASGIRADLLRQGQSLPEWTRQLRSLAAPSGYRGGKSNVEHLFAAVADDRLSAEERIGAALALTGQPDTQTRDTLRTTSKSISQKALRLAIEHVADDTLQDDHIARALSTDGHRWST